MCGFICGITPNYNSMKLCFAYLGRYLLNDLGKTKTWFSLSRRFGSVKVKGATINYLYFTEQPYGRELGVVTGLPASDSSSATFT